MGVLNLTPDSFHKASRLDSTESAVSRAIEMVGQGADWIDIGGDSGTKLFRDGDFAGEFEFGSEV